jgi:hypothetical protein
MPELLTRFRKTFFWPWSYKKWEGRFASLSTPQQKAFIQLLENNVDRKYAFQAVRKADYDNLLVNFDATVKAIDLEYRQSLAW